MKGMIYSITAYSVQSMQGQETVLLMAMNSSKKSE